MADTSEREMISRRGVFRILRLATLGLAATHTLLTISDAKAQGFFAIPGTEEPQEQHTKRTGRRREPRTGHTERQKRTGTTPKPKTTAPNP